MQMVRMEMELDILRMSVLALLESNNIEQPKLDAGKWFNTKLDGLDKKWKDK